MRQVHGDRTARVCGRAESGKWIVEWGRAAATGGQARARPDLREAVEVCGGEFDVVVLAFEAKKIASGCASGYKMVRPSATPHVSRSVRAVRHHEQALNLLPYTRALYTSHCMRCFTHRPAPCATMSSGPS